MVLRGGAARPNAAVWAGEVQVAQHAGGYTPFEAEVTEHVGWGEPLRVTVGVGNELTMETIPPGVASRSASGRKKQRYFHDFFNYAGLHRSVWLYATPRSYVADISVGTAFDPGTGTGQVSYRIEAAGAGATSVRLRDAKGAGVAQGPGAGGDLTVPAALPWSPDDPHLYRLDVAHGDDHYHLPVGIRTLAVEVTAPLLNGRPVIRRGLG